VPIPDERFEWLCEVYKPASRIPAFLTCIDIAGLTAGASTGAGLGNAFLSHVRAVDGIFQVIRTSFCRCSRLAVSHLCIRRIRRRRGHPRRGRREPRPRHGNHPDRAAAKRYRMGAKDSRDAQEDFPWDRNGKSG
jgi:hypothetical protein